MKKEESVSSLEPIMTPEDREKIYTLSSNAALHYKEVIDEIKKAGRKKIRFAAYVIYGASYGIDGTFQLMMKDRAHWDPKVVIIPDVLRGEDNAKRTYYKTREYFIEKYGQSYVMDGYSIDTNEYLDLLDEFDIVYFANPYDCMVHEFHKITYAATKNVLPIYVSYGYDVGQYTTLERMYAPELNLVWKCFADTRYSYSDYKKYQAFKGKNVVLSGYSKMDELAKIEEKKRERKKILISPHHTVNYDKIPLSNFLEYSELVLELPKLYPDIEFVFRPHPLLFTNLINNKIWTEEQVEKYISQLTELGVEYSTESDYLHLYRECDAIINDCGSFTVEWLYTGKPGCFVYSDKLSDDKLTKLMKKAISGHYIARSREDILRFIEKVVNAKACSKKRMKWWVRRNIAVNYPNVSDAILKELNLLKHT